MAQTQRSNEDCRKAPASRSTLFRGDLSNSDEGTISANKQVPSSLQRHYDKGRDDITPREAVSIGIST